MPTQLAERPLPPTFPAADPPWGAAPPPAGPTAGGSAGGGRPRRHRRVAAGVAALALVLSSGLAGAYATRLEGRPVAAVATATAATATRAETGSLAAVASAVTPSVVAITVRAGGQEAEGSGVVLTADGAILTNAHVVDALAGATITVELSDGSKAPASVVGTDPVTDLAVIQARGVSGLRPASFGDSDALEVGDTVLAVGSPLGLEGSVTAGIVSALHRTITVGGDGRSAETLDDAVQTDAAINPGNSGGPLVDDAGRVVGITTANASVDGESAGSIGVGFAIPANQARQVATRLLSAT